MAKKKGVKGTRRLSKAAIERQRALLARERFLAEKVRIASRQARAARYSHDPLVIEKRMVRALEKFRRTHKRSDYGRFREAKRLLYTLAPLQAPGMVQDAAMESGWNESQSAKFSRLS